MLRCERDKYSDFDDVALTEIIRICAKKEPEETVSALSGGKNCVCNAPFWVWKRKRLFTATPVLNYLLVRV